MSLNFCGQTASAAGNVNSPLQSPELLPKLAESHLATARIDSSRSIVDVDTKPDTGRHRKGPTGSFLFLNTCLECAALALTEQGHVEMP